MARQPGGARLLGGLLLLALLAAGAAPLGWDLPESRGRAIKSRVYPRGNLWATGEFLGADAGSPSPCPDLNSLANPNSPLTTETRAEQVRTGTSPI